MIKIKCIYHNTSGRAFSESNKKLCMQLTIKPEHLSSVPRLYFPVPIQIKSKNPKITEQN